MKKKAKEAVWIAGYISEFLNDYAPNFLTNSEHTLKSYKDTLTVYVIFLESEGITPSQLDKSCFEKAFIEKWIKWMKKERKCCPDTCNVRFGSLRVFLEFLGNKDIGLLYLYQEARTIKRQKCAKKKVNGLTRAAVTAILEAPDLTSKTGKRDIVFLTILYATAGRLDEIRSIKISLMLRNPILTYTEKAKKYGRLTCFRERLHISKYI